MGTATKSINLISKSSTFGPGRTDHFMEELSYVLTNSFVPCVPVRFFFFFTAAHFHLAGRWHFSFSHRCYEISCLSSNEIRLFCF